MALGSFYKKNRPTKVLGDALDISWPACAELKDGDVTIVGFLSHNGEFGVNGLKEELFKLYTTVKLSGDLLPKNFFHVDVFIDMDNNT